MIMLVVFRLLSPDSEKQAFEERDRYFERFNFSLADVYRSLPHFSKIAKEFQCYSNSQVAAKYGHDTKIIYYNVTGLYFKTDEADESCKSGLSRGKRQVLTMQMGLAMDAGGIPLCYELFPGDTVEEQIFRPVIGAVGGNQGTGSIIVVANMGTNTGDNIFYLQDKGKETNFNGYVFGFSVRGGTKAFEDYVLSEQDYLDNNGQPAGKDVDLKVKSRVIVREIIVTMPSGEKGKEAVCEKQVVLQRKTTM